MSVMTGNGEWFAFVVSEDEALELLLPGVIFPRVRRWVEVKRARTTLNISAPR